jgi:hypothetical protein
MIKWAARIDSDDPVGVLAAVRDKGKSALSTPIELVAARSGNSVCIGFASEDERLPLAVAHRIFTCAYALSADTTLKLTWNSSSIQTDSSELAALMRRWNETAEPPVLSIIGIELGEYRHATRGLTTFAGHELQARFPMADQSRDAARSLVRLTRYALTNGGIVRDCEYQCIDGSALRLDWPDEGAISSMVTIVF